MYKRLMLFALVTVALLSFIMVLVYLFSGRVGGGKPVKVPEPTTTQPRVRADVPSSNVKEEPPAPAIALVLDDLGYGEKLLQEIAALGIPVTLAVLPDLAFSSRVCDFADAEGLDTILHLPMEPFEVTSGLEKNTIMTDMSDREILDILDNDLASVKNAKGVSNHMGSRATTDEHVMDVIMGDLERRGLFFLDSYTSASSVVEASARRMGVPAIKRGLFIDNQLDREYIKGQMAKLAELSRKNGYAVGIGHYRQATVEALKEVVPEILGSDVVFVRLPELIGRLDGENE
ncbi:MAG: divergent polysaccharide deacetylase family protein [Candidatus Omnitrophica bacterium]|nr:divergent polysaccharide deacetylase family protein [Candidatus Omnitrophota bacterium]MDD5488407.1 divergent polysaccharide deacetylase family protein [Candidatus Omnitrophota bacterium]